MGSEKKGPSPRSKLGPQQKIYEVSVKDRFSLSLLSRKRKKKDDKFNAGGILLHPYFILT